MDSLDLIETFRQVVQRGSFSAAARSLDMSPAHVSKCMAALEQRFGVRLFNRTTRSMSLTDAGHLLYERSAPMLDLVHTTREELHARAGSPSGKLTLAFPHGLMQSRLPQVLGEFLAQHPKVSLQLRAASQTLALVEEGIDLALCVGPIPDVNGIVRRLLRVRFVVVATPGYWQAHGVPSHPRELAAHRTLSVSKPEQPIAWPFVEGKRRFEVPLQPLVASTDVTPLGSLALQGLGVAYLPHIAIESQLRSGVLRSVLDTFMPDDIYLYALYAQHRHNSAALKALLQFLEEHTRQWFQPPAPASSSPCS